MSSGLLGSCCTATPYGFELSLPGSIAEAGDSICLRLVVIEHCSLITGHCDSHSTIILRNPEGSHSIEQQHLLLTHGRLPGREPPYTDLVGWLLTVTVTDGSHLASNKQAVCSSMATFKGVSCHCNRRIRPMELALRKQSPTRLVYNATTKGGLPSLCHGGR